MKKLTNLHITLLVLLTLIIGSVAHAQRAPGSGLRPADPAKMPGVAIPIKDTDVEIKGDEGDTSEAAKENENTAEFNAKNAEIASVIRIFSKKTKRNYILDERVKGKVSIYLPGKISADQSLKILDSVLALKGFTAVPIGENLWKVIPSKEAKQSTIPTVKDNNSSGSSSVITKILNLKYIAADEAKEIITPLVSPDGLVSAYGGTNALLLIDYEDNVIRLAGIIDTVDVPFSNREMTLIPIKHAEAKDVAEKLQDILGIGQSKGDAKSGGGSESGLDLVRAKMRDNAANNIQPNGAILGGQQGQNAGQQQSRSTEPKIISDERTNSIIVVADDDTTARVRALISQLDSEIDLSGNRFYVYRCQHANAEELANVLSGLAGGEGGSSSQKSGSSNLLGSGGGTQGDVSINTSSRNRGGQFDKTQSRLGGQKRTPGRSRTENGGESSGATSVQLGENISITADKATNSLIIIAGKADYEKIVELLKQLDIKRRQVLVEALILEVGVDDQSTYGVDWLTSTGGADGGVLAKSDFGGDSGLAGFLSNPAKVSQFSVAAASKGVIKLPGNITIPTQAVLLSAAQANTNVNVLSSPNILTTDNEEAEIVVGQNVPFLASRSTSDANLNNTFNQIDRQDVGITLRLTPQISSQSFVTLKIFTEVSSVVNQTELGPTTAVRTSETTVISKDGQMVVTGGLLADTSNDSDSGIPFFKDIPVLGYMFKHGNTTHQKTNLLIFITPRIVQDQFDHRDLTLEHRDVLENEIDANAVHPDRKEFLESPSLDNVTEAASYTGPKPSTILPPAKPPTESDMATNPQVLSETKPSVSHSPSVDTPGVIHLKVAPKLPVPKPGNSKVDEEKRGMLSPSAIKEQSGASSRFYIMSVEPSGDGSDKVPFVADKKTSLFGIEIPEGSAPSALQFFTNGGKYQYAGDKGSIPLTVQGAYSNRREAQSRYQGSSITWYTLSPYEVMSLGKSLWTQR